MLPPGSRITMVQLANGGKLDIATAPGFMINGLKREELIAWNSMILHELFFDGLGDEIFNFGGRGVGVLGDDDARGLESQRQPLDLRLALQEQGQDPRKFSLIAFGGAGPLHSNALSRLLGSWPSIIPPGPGVLCALGDATTAVRDESSRTFIRKFAQTSKDEIAKLLKTQAADAASALASEKVAAADMEFGYQVDVRYHGQGLRLTVDAIVRRDYPVIQGVVLVVSGIFASWRQVGFAIRGYTDTSYGNMLLVKLAIVAGLIGIAAVSRSAGSSP